MPPKKTREEIAAENVKGSADAHAAAAEQRRLDLERGEKSPVLSVADSIRGKLEREEFQKAPPAPGE